MIVPGHRDEMDGITGLPSTRNQCNKAAALMIKQNQECKSPQP